MHGRSTQPIYIDDDSQSASGYLYIHHAREPTNPPLVTLQSSPSVSWCRKIGNFLLTPIAACLHRLRHQPALTTFSTISALPSICYSLTLPSGNQPSDISLDWWHSMSEKLIAISVICALAVLLYNIYSNEKYVPASYIKLRNNLKTCRDVPSFFSNTVLIFLGLYAAMSAAGAAFDSFSWTSTPIRLAITAFCFFSTAARRYTGVADLFVKVQDLFNQDVRFQKRMVKELERFKAEYRFLYDMEFQETVPNPEVAYQFALAIYDRALGVEQSSALNPSIFNIEKIATHRRNQSVHFLWVLASTIMAIATTLVNIQLGYEGINIISRVGFNYSLDQLENSIKFMVGFFPGLTNGIFYLISMLNCIHTFADLHASAKRDPQSTGYFLFIIGITALTITAYVAIAAGVVNNENILGIEPFGRTSLSVIVISGFSVFLTSVNNIDNHLVSTKPYAQTCADFITYLDRHKLSRGQTQSLRAHSYFSPDRQEKREIKKAFLMGLHQRIGEKSSLSALRRNSLFDPVIMKDITDFLPSVATTEDERVRHLAAIA